MKFLYTLVLFITSIMAEVDYNSEIQPIFVANCVNCHGNSGGLSLLSYESLMNGGISGEEIIPYDHMSSELWIRVNSGQMPLGDDDLSEEEVDLIAQWIDEGANEFVANSMVNLITPINGSDLNYIHIYFEWEQYPDASSYQLQWSTTVSFSNSNTITSSSTGILIDVGFDWQTTYYWRVAPVISGIQGDFSEAFSFSTKNTKFDIELTCDDFSNIQDGVTLFGDLWGFQSGIMDGYGNEIWNDGDANFMMNHVDEYGQIFGFSTDDYPNKTGTAINMNTDYVWQAPEGVVVDIHEVKQISNGNYMGFVSETVLGPIPTDAPNAWVFELNGYEVDGVTPEFPWTGQKLVEWDKDTNEEIWSWNPFDHYTMEDYDRYEGTWWSAFYDGFHDWTHSNAFYFDVNESAVYMSNRHLSRITKIDYFSGDIIWMMGMPADYMSSGNEHICTDIGFSFQHNIKRLENGNLLFFDNGNLSEMLRNINNPITRMLEVEVIDNSYCNIIWEYELPQDLYSPWMGSVRLLDNGNYLINAVGGDGHILEVNPEKEIIWDIFLDLVAPTGNNYRAYRIPSLHPEAFSIVADGYTNVEDNNIIQISNGSSIDFTIFNESGYTQSYTYIFTDLMDGGESMFEYEEGDLIISPWEYIELSFPIIGDIASTTIGLNIWPTYHDFAIKELTFIVKINDNIVSGDINSDGMINVLDVVMLVNIVLGQAGGNPSADINGDGIYNVLDVVQLVNLILNM